jgi:hypothetical protein
LVLHPVISSFLLLKWKRIDFLVYLSLLSYFGFMLYLGFFIINFYKVSTIYSVDKFYCDAVQDHHMTLFNGTSHKFSEDECSMYTDYAAAPKLVFKSRKFNNSTFDSCFENRGSNNISETTNCFKAYSENEAFRKFMKESYEKANEQIKNNSLIYEDKKKDEMWKNSFRQHFKENEGSYWFCICGLVVLSLYELIQFCNSWKTYFLDLGNFLDVSLIALSFFVLIKNVEVGHGAFKQICAIMILLMAGQSIQSISKVSAFSLSLHMEMLNKVFKTFVKTIAPYLIIIMAFGMSFYAINFDDNPKNVDGSETPTSGFAFPFIALISTVRMMLSDFGAVTITEEDRFQGIIFLLFMVFISIVLFNLLNALAISDTNEILKVAEFVEIRKRISTVQTYEKLFIIFKLKYLKIFPKVKTIMLEPNKTFDVKYQDNAPPKFNANESILIEKVDKNQKFKEVLEHKLIFWRSKVVKFDKPFLKKVLEYIKSVQESADDKILEEENAKDLQKIKDTQSRVDQKLETILRTLSEVSSSRSSMLSK